MPDPYAAEMAEIPQDKRRRIAVEAIANVAAEHLRTVNAYMTRIEGPTWARGIEAELQVALDKVEGSPIFWRIGRRRFQVAEKLGAAAIVIETTETDGMPTRRRTIGPVGVLGDETITQLPPIPPNPSAN